MIRSKLVKKIGYKVLNVLCKNGITVTINNFPLRLPVDYFRLFPNDYEKENFEYIIANLKEGDTVIDIGAHIGLTAAVFGRIVKAKGKVFSFEPTASSFKTLKETIRINKLQNIVTPVNMPVTEHSGKVTFFVSETDVDVANSLVNWEEGKKLNTVEMDATSIDDFVNVQQLDKVNFIKVDAEGAELNVLKGGIKTFTNHKPLVIFALHPPAIQTNGDSLQSIYEFIKKMGYNVYFENKELGIEEFCKKQTLFDVHLSAQ